MPQLPYMPPDAMRLEIAAMTAQTTKLDASRYEAAKIDE